MLKPRCIVFLSKFSLTFLFFSVSLVSQSRNSTKEVNKKGMVLLNYNGISCNINHHLVHFTLGCPQLVFFNVLQISELTVGNCEEPRAGQDATGVLTHRKV